MLKELFRIFMLLRTAAISPLCNERGAVGEDAGNDEGKGDLPPDDTPPAETDKLLVDLGYTAEEIADLSDEEKEGILMKDEEEETGDKVDSDTRAALEAISKEGETAEEKAAREAAEAAVSQGKTAEELAAAAASAPKDPPEKTIAVDDDLLKFKPVIAESDLPAVDSIIPAELSTKLLALDEKYDAGEIEMKDYMSQREAINRNIYRAQDRSLGAAREELAWQKTQLYFFENRPEYLKKDVTEPKELLRRDAMFGALEKMVSTMTTDPKYTHYSDMQVLIEADKIVKEAFGVKPTAVSSAGKDKLAAIIKEKPKAPLPDHVTLGDIPAAGAEDVGDDPYAVLDKLTGEAYEAALERLTPTQKDAYEAGASKPARRRVA